MAGDRLLEVARALKTGPQPKRSVIFLFTDWSAATSIAVCSPIVILFCYWSLPRFMALWVGIEYLTDVTNDEPWIRD